MSEEPRAAGATMATLGGLMAYWGYVDAINMAAAPYLAAEFRLDDSAIAAAFGWTAIGALASLPIARAADRRGRRRVLLLCVLALPPLSLVTAWAPSLSLFVLAQIPVQALKGVLMTVIPVMVAEALPMRRRAGGQALVGLTGALGSGLALMLMAAVADLDGAWRWGWSAAILGGLALPSARRSLTESAHFERSAASGEAQRSRARELFRPPLRSRTIGTLVVGSLYPFAINGAQFWLIYHPVRNLGIEPWVATVVVIAGGAVSLAGFPAGGRMCESWGRRYTFASASLVFAVAAWAYYRVPADFAPHPGVALGACFAVMAFASSAALVPLRAAGTELFPTRLRGAMSGALALAVAAALVAANFSVALLAALLGGIAPAASLAATAILPAAVVFLVLLPETRGVELE